MSFHVTKLTGLDAKAQGRIIRRALRDARGNVTKAALQLDVTRRHLTRLIAALTINPSFFRRHNQ